MASVPTYLAPLPAQRHASVTARVAHYARYVQMMHYAGQAVMPMCLTCGEGTGNWCDPCEFAGRVWPHAGLMTGLMQGTPLCTDCERTHKPCRVCTGQIAPFVPPVGAAVDPVLTEADFAAAGLAL